RPWIGEARVMKKLGVGQAFEKREEVFLLSFSQFESVDVRGLVRILMPASGGIMIDNFIQRGSAAIVHIGRGRMKLTSCSFSTGAAVCKCEFLSIAGRAGFLAVQRQPAVVEKVSAQFDFGCTHGVVCRNCRTRKRFR